MKRSQKGSSVGIARTKLSVIFSAARQPVVTSPLAGGKGIHVSCGVGSGWYARRAVTGRRTLNTTTRGVAGFYGT